VIREKGSLRNYDLITNERNGGTGRILDLQLTARGKVNSCQFRESVSNSGKWNHRSA